MTEYKTLVAVPQVRDHDRLLHLYHFQTEIGVKDIREIFGCSSTTAQKLIRRAREEMENRNTPNWNPHMVNVEDAVTAWGIDVGKVERAVKKLRLNGGESAK